MVKPSMAFFPDTWQLFIALDDVRPALIVASQVLDLIGRRCCHSKYVQRSCEVYTLHASCPNFGIFAGIRDVFAACL